MSSAWTTAADVRARVRRRWDDGTLLRLLAAGAPGPDIDIPLRGPAPGKIGDDLGAVQTWVAGLEKGARGGRCYDLEWTEVGGRVIGRNRLPARARIATFEQAWSLTDCADRVETYRQLLDAAGAVPAIREWAAAQPLQALEVAADWPALLAAFSWLDGARGSGAHLREITAPGVDTKFVERHRGLLARLLAVPSTAEGFTAGLGLQIRPRTLRVRFDASALGLPPPLSEATLRVEELAALPARVATAVVVENEATYLSVPVPQAGVVIWGKGFEVDRAGALPWLASADLSYWGDLDTHGFAILDRLRAWFPRTRSILMDRQTLLAHRVRWVREPMPTSARLGRLDDVEAALYADLVSDRLGEHVRLEQERIDWAWASERLTYTAILPLSRRRSDRWS